MVSKLFRPAQSTPAFPAAFEAGHSEGGSGGSLMSPHYVGALSRYAPPAQSVHACVSTML